MTGGQQLQQGQLDGTATHRNCDKKQWWHQTGLCSTSKQHAGPGREETLTTAYTLDTNLLSAAERRLFTMSCASKGSMSGLQKGSGSHALPPLPLQAPNSQAATVSTGPAQHPMLLCGALLACPVNHRSPFRGTQGHAHGGQGLGHVFQLLPACHRHLCWQLLHDDRGCRQAGAHGVGGLDACELEKQGYAGSFQQKAQLRMQGSGSLKQPLGRVSLPHPRAAVPGPWRAPAAAACSTCHGRSLQCLQASAPPRQTARRRLRPCCWEQHSCSLPGVTAAFGLCGCAGHRGWLKETLESSMRWWQGREAAACRAEWKKEIRGGGSAVTAQCAGTHAPATMLSIRASHTAGARQSSHLARTGRFLRCLAECLASSFK